MELQYEQYLTCMRIDAENVRPLVLATSTGTGTGTGTRTSTSSPVHTQDTKPALHSVPVLLPVRLFVESGFSGSPA